MGPPSNIGHSAHIGGFVAGMLLATLANRFVPSDNER
jgi:membrane associated rhomboid family serine protease